MMKFSVVDAEGPGLHHACCVLKSLIAHPREHVWVCIKRRLDVLHEHIPGHPLSLCAGLTCLQMQCKIGISQGRVVSRESRQHMLALAFSVAHWGVVGIHSTYSLGFIVAYLSVHSSPVSFQHSVQSWELGKVSR